MSRVSVRAPDQLASRKYGKLERERRWLVRRDARPALVDLPHRLIEDHYIRGTHLRLRRMTESKTGEVTFKLTKKYESNDPMARWIVTAYLTQSEHDVFTRLDGDALTKRRYSVTHDDLVWSIDCFEPPLDIELLEIEAPDAETLERLHPPAWATEEVTLKTEFEGASLAALSRRSAA